MELDPPSCRSLLLTQFVIPIPSRKKGNLSIEKGALEDRGNMLQEMTGEGGQSASFVLLKLLLFSAQTAKSEIIHILSPEQVSGEP